MENTGRTEFREWAGDADELEGYEQNGFQHLRDEQGRLVPLLRVMPRDREPDPFNYEGLARRTARSAPPIVDLLLEVQRLFCFSEFPSRQRSLFCNLGAYQPQFLQSNPDASVYLVLPLDSANICISGVTDFRIENPLQVCEWIERELAKRFDEEDVIAPLRMAQYRERQRPGDFVQHHRMLDLMDLFQGWFEVEPEAHPELVEVLSYWRESALVEDGKCRSEQIGSEVLVQGAAKFIEVLR